MWAKNGVKTSQWFLVVWHPKMHGKTFLLFWLTALRHFAQVLVQQMKGFKTSGAACSGQNRATAQPRNSAGSFFTQLQFGNVAFLHHRFDLWQHIGAYNSANTSAHFTFSILALKTLNHLARQSGAKAAQRPSGYGPTQIGFKSDVLNATGWP
jgi:hypothetical protein